MFADIQKYPKFNDGNRVRVAMIDFGNSGKENYEVGDLGVIKDSNVAFGREVGVYMVLFDNKTEVEPVCAEDLELIPNLESHPCTPPAQ